MCGSSWSSGLAPYTTPKRHSNMQPNSSRSRMRYPMRFSLSCVSISKSRERWWVGRGSSTIRTSMSPTTSTRVYASLGNCSPMFWNWGSPPGPSFSIRPLASSIPTSSAGARSEPARRRAKYIESWRRVCRCRWASRTAQTATSRWLWTRYRPRAADTCSRRSPRKGRLRF